MVERLLGLGLTKGHGAAGWSKRPYPRPWLNYAALDVVYSSNYARRSHGVLAEQGKTDWAAQNSEHLRCSNQGHPSGRPAGPLATNASGIHKVHDRRGWPRSRIVDGA